MIYFQFQSTLNIKYIIYITVCNKYLFLLYILSIENTFSEIHNYEKVRLLTAIECASYISKILKNARIKSNIIQLYNLRSII